MYAVTKNNPAGRLFHILQTAKAQAMRNFTLAQMCAEVFSIKAEERGNVSEHRSLIIRLIDATQKSIKRNPNLNPALFLASLPEIKQKMEESTIDSPWSVVAEAITEKALTELAFCSEALSNLETLILSSELESIAQQVEELARKNSEDHSAGEEVRELITSLLEIIRGGIRGYKVEGAIALQEALAVCIGKLLVMRSPGFMEEKEKALLSEIKNILTNIDWVVGKAFDYKSLFESVGPLLPGLANTSSQGEEIRKNLVR